MQISVSLEQIEFFLAILVRVSAFMFTAPFFNTNNVPNRVKAGLAIFVAFVVNNSVPYTPLEYGSILSYSIIIMKEAVGGAILGFFANVAQHILSFVGQRIDIDMGFSMVSEFSQVTGSEVTITGTFYSYAVILIMMVTDLHLFLVQALAESFNLIPVGGITVDSNIYELMMVYMADYFILAFRIVLPMYAAILIVDTILGILAKVAPQMNMFAVGIQLKVSVGLITLYFMIRLLPGVSRIIYNEMFDLLQSSVYYLGGS